MAEHVTKVFISATSRDLRSMRGVVRDALLNMGCLPVVQEHFPPDYRDVTGMLRDKISECDALIHIAGMCYGAEPDPESIPEGQPRRSYTQMEVDLARELKLEKVFTFVCPEEFPYDTTDGEGSPLPDEPAELRDLQRAHRERLLEQKELRYKVSSPAELAAKVREMQLELAEVKGDLKRTRGKMLKAGVGIVAALLFVAAGVFIIGKDTKDIRDDQETLKKQVEISQQAPRVLAAYQDRFREIRDNRSLGETLPNAAIDSMVRAELPGILQMDEDTVKNILEIEAPRLAAGRGTPINLRLAALFALGDYDETLEQGKEMLVEPTIAGLRTMGDAALAKFQKDPSKKWEDEALRYYSGSQALIDKKSSPVEWCEATHLIGYVNFRKGEYDTARKQFEVALDVWKKTDPDHPGLLMTANNLATTLTAMGRMEDAERIYRETLDTMKRVKGPDDVDTLVTMNGLGQLLMHTGKYGEAETLIVKAVNGLKETRGIADPFTMIAINNMAALLQLIGDFESAEKVYRELLGLSEKALGKSHPDTLRIKGNLATVLQLRGDYEEAEALLRDALDACSSILGSEHPETIRMRNNLAVNMYHRRDFEGAEPLFQEVSQQYEKTLGRKHSATLMALFNVSRIYLEKGDLAEAEKLSREVLELRKEVLGETHPDTAASMSSLGSVLAQMGKSDEAEELLRSALNIRMRTVGREHPDTMNAMNTLMFFLNGEGVRLFQLGKNDEATIKYAEAFRFSRQVKAPLVDPLIIQANLGAAKREAGELKPAKAMLDRVVREWARREQPDPTVYGRACYHLALTEQRLGNLDAAADQLRKSLTLYATLPKDSELLPGLQEPSRMALREVLSAKGLSKQDIDAELDKLGGG